MENELIEGTNNKQEIVVTRDPNIVLAEAKNAANVLMSVVNQKKKPVIINNEQYLEFEDWMTLARFYGISVKVIKTQLIDLGGVKGFEATAEAIRNSDGMIISSADAMCLNDEDKWSTRGKYEYVNGIRKKTGDIPVPLFQLRSMAQTRACAKALRNVLAWVVVLAGFKPTPAEEMTDGLNQAPNPKANIKMPQAKNETEPIMEEEPSEEQKFITCSSCGDNVPDKVHKFSMKKFNKPLCFKCQKNETSDEK